VVVIAAVCAGVLLAGAALVGVNVIADRQAERAYDAASAAVASANTEQDKAATRLADALDAANREHASATALLGAADPAMLTEEAPLAKLPDLISQLEQNAGIPAADPASEAPASSTTATAPATPAPTPPATRPEGRDALQAAAAQLLEGADATGKSTEETSAKVVSIDASILSLRRVEESVLSAAFAKGTSLEVPEGASQEAKDAFAASLAAMQNPASDADIGTLVQSYQSAWQGVVASNEEAARAADPASVEPTYIRGILVVNKTYPLPSWYGNGLTAETSAAFDAMRAEAASKGLDIYISSGFRSYASQVSIYNRYVASDGQAAADRYSARPGYSEHQSGLTFDLNSIDESFAYTPEGEWVRDNAHRFGFIIRYPQGKEGVTGYIWEPWHLRYLGVDTATAVYNSGLSLEEYLGITSQYAN